MHFAVRQLDRLFSRAAVCITIGFHQFLIRPAFRSRLLHQLRADLSCPAQCLFHGSVFSLHVSIQVDQLAFQFCSVGSTVILPFQVPGNSVGALVQHLLRSGPVRLAGFLQLLPAFLPGFFHAAHGLFRNILIHKQCPKHAIAVFLGLGRPRKPSPADLFTAHRALFFLHGKADIFIFGGCFVIDQFYLLRIERNVLFIAVVHAIISHADQVFAGFNTGIVFALVSIQRFIGYAFRCRVFNIQIKRSYIFTIALRIIVPWAEKRALNIHVCAAFGHIKCVELFAGSMINNAQVSVFIYDFAILKVAALLLCKCVTLAVGISKRKLHSRFSIFNRKHIRKWCTLNIDFSSKFAYTSIITTWLPRVGHTEAQCLKQLSGFFCIIRSINHFAFTHKFYRVCCFGISRINLLHIIKHKPFFFWVQIQHAHNWLSVFSFQRAKQKDSAVVRNLAFALQNHQRVFQNLRDLFDLVQRDFRVIF